MLAYKIWGNTLAAWGVSLLYVLGAVAIVILLNLLGRKIIGPFVRRTENRIDDTIYYALDAPVKFAVMLLGIWIAIHKLVYPDSFVRVVDKAYRILIVLDITWVFVRLTGGLIQNYGTKTGDSRKMMPVIRRAVLVVIWIVGGIMALSNIGVNISALLGTLGIGGIAFALAAQDTVKNVFGAITIFTDKPFAIGDTIRVDNLEGTVIDVGMRSTRIMGYDRRITTYPNYRITDASIVNISSEPMRRITVTLRLEYTTSVEKMTQALEILRAIPGQVDALSDTASDISVNFSEFTESALVVTCYYYIKKGGDILGTASAANMAILEAFNKAEMRFAYPSRTLYIHRGTFDEIPEGGAGTVLRL